MLIVTRSRNSIRRYSEKRKWNKNNKNTLKYSNSKSSSESENHIKTKQVEVMAMG